MAEMGTIYNGDNSQRRGPLNGQEQSFNNLLRNNQLGIEPTSIDNPLFYVPPDELPNDVRQFHRDHGLGEVVEVNLLLRGARLAQDGGYLEDCTDVERRALQDEDKPSLPSQPRAGWTQANLTGANLNWPYELFDAQKRPLTQSEVWKFGAVNSVTYFSCSFLGGWLSDPLSEHAYGRRGALFIAGLFSLASCIGSGYIKSWQGLLACRITQGIGMGAKASIVPIFESEVSPSRIRGRFLVSWQTFVGDFYQLHCQLQVENILLDTEKHPEDHWQQPISQQTNFFQRFGQLFTIPRNQRASTAACIVMAAHFITNTTSSGPSGIPQIRSLCLSLGFALANAVFSPLAYFTIDSKGRRFLLLLSLVLMVPLLIAAGFSLGINTVDPNNPIRVGVFETFLILYTAAYSPGAGVVPFLYSSEVFPMVHRGAYRALTPLIAKLVANSS
ncbi:sugar transporter [Talaromyces pinophilus]|uniref:Sugar transporter n=1 Tax=Talaromyces pinophilus TaxID=128442 RepID=A0A6V8HQ77_TALPI|nr:sugar transporter [Talaromyces pinophilus]